MQSSSDTAVGVDWLKLPSLNNVYLENVIYLQGNQ